MSLNTDVLIIHLLSESTGSASVTSSFFIEGRCYSQHTGSSQRNHTTQQHCCFTHGTDQSLASMQTQQATGTHLECTLVHIYSIISGRHRKTVSCCLWQTVLPHHNFTVSAFDTVNLPHSLFEDKALL